MRLAPVAHRVQQWPQGLSKGRNGVYDARRCIRVNGTLNDSGALQFAELLRERSLRNSANSTLQFREPLGTLEKLIENGGFPASADNARGGFYRADLYILGHDGSRTTLYTTYQSDVTYSDVTMLVGPSSILTTAISRPDLQATRAPRIANRRKLERETPKTARETQMQLETTELGKSKNRTKVPRPLMLAVGLAALAGLSVGCSSSAEPKAPTAPGVSVAEVICKQIGDSDEFTGRLEAVNAVEVRPRVSGYLQSVDFKEGAIVRQGDLLFQIDRRPFQAEVDRLRGDLSQARAQRSRAESDFARAERLHNNDGMSAEEYDRRAAVRNEAEARIASTEAALRGAELNLEFTRVTAPITGRVGRAEITEGNLVESGAAQVKPLTTLVSLDPIYVYFDVDEQTYLKYARLTQGHGTSSHDLRSAAQLGLADEDGFPHTGQVSFVDNQVSSSTGTIRLRATFANTNLALTPGLFARIRLQGGGASRGCLAKDEAIVTDLNQRYVFVLGKDNKLEYRSVKLGPMTEGLRVVRDGLHEGDVVVVNGLQRVRPGAAVTPQKVSMAAQSNSSSEASTRSASQSRQEPSREPKARE
jgi:multidrug efflux system membrane fusion protein